MKKMLFSENEFESLIKCGWFAAIYPLLFTRQFPVVNGNSFNYISKNMIIILRGNIHYWRIF